jgi:Phage integrase, N-terminal SAM-like domain
MRLCDYLDRWLDNIRPSLKTSTFIIYRRIINHQITEKFGDLALTQLNWKDVRDWQARESFTIRERENAGRETW